jgi:lipoyl(octanoyl) transferase
LISLIQLGTVDYATGLKLQQQLVALRKEEKIGDVLLLLEHSPVITLGRNAKAANIIASPELLAQRGVELFECDRGGDVTFHGPGQIVGYPIFDLRGYGTNLSSRARQSERDGESRDLGVGVRKYLGAVDFVRSLEEVLIRTCADFAIPAKRIPGLTGVWTDDASLTDHVGTAAPGCPVEQSSTASAKSASHVEAEHDREGPDFSRADSGKNKAAASAAEGPEAKLAAIGVHISRFVTSHGFALNVNSDLNYFDLIIPCGITSKPVTSMQKELGRALDLNAVAESISRNFGVVFQSQILWVDTLDALLGRTVGIPMKPPTELRQLHQEDDSTWA